MDNTINYKYTISINQRAVIEMGLLDRVDFIDLAIYDYIIDFILSDQCSKILDGNEQFYWIKASSIISGLPLIGISTERGINKRIDKLVECDLLERYKNNQKLHTSYFKLGKRYLEYKFVAWNENSKGAWNENSKNYINNIDYTKEGDITISPKKEEEKNKKRAKNINYQAIVDCWNEYNGKVWGKVAKLTEGRKDKIKKALEKNDISEDELIRLFRSLPYADSWLSNPSKEHKTWKPDFDWWIANTNNWLTKAIEGNVHKENRHAFERIMNGSNDYIPSGKGIIFSESLFVNTLLVHNKSDRLFAVK